MTVWVNSEWIYSLCLVLWWLPIIFRTKSCLLIPTTSLLRAALLRSPPELAHLRNRNFMLQRRGAGWQSQNAQPCPSLSDLVRAVTKAVLRRPSSSYWVEKCSQTEGSLFPQCSCGAFALSTSGLSHCRASQTIGQRACRGQGLGLGNRHSEPKSYLRSVYRQASYINLFYFLKIMRGMYPPFNALYT